MKCKGCGKQPHQISEYCDAAKIEMMLPDDFVAREEGTYNSSTKLFWCTGCYVKAGTPKGKA